MESQCSNQKKRINDLEATIRDLEKSNKEKDDLIEKQQKEIETLSKVN